jgi:hypothetical protein
VKKHYVRNAMVCLGIVIGSIAPLAASPPKKPPKKLDIASVTPTPDPKVPSHFDQIVTVAFKSASPGATILAPTEWSLVLSYDDKSRVFLQGTSATAWTKTVIGGSGQILSAPQVVSPVPMQAGGAPQIIVTPSTSFTNEVYLALPADAMTNHVTSLQVSFDDVQLQWNPSSTTSQTSLFEAASSQSESDNFLTGSYSPAIHSAAQYTINGQGTLVKEIGLSNVYLGAIATVATDNRPTADPDSFLVSSVLQWVPKATHFWGGVAQGVLLDWDLAGLEFDRQTTTKTFISSPIAEIPLRLYPAPKKAIGHLTAAMYPYFGLETGTNLSNALEPGGSGFVFRGLFGTSLSLTTKTSWKWLQQIGLTATDTIRIPATNEIFTNTHYISETGKTVSLPVLSTQVRNHVNGQLAFTVAKPFSITVKYEDGELPPGFRTIKNKVTIGLTVTLKQRNGALPKVDPEK